MVSNNTQSNNMVSNSIQSATSQNFQNTNLQQMQSNNTQSNNMVSNNIYSQNVGNYRNLYNQYPSSVNQNYDQANLMNQMRQKEYANMQVSNQNNIQPNKNLSSITNIVNEQSGYNTNVNSNNLPSSQNPMQNKPHYPHQNENLGNNSPVETSQQAFVNSSNNVIQVKEEANTNPNGNETISNINPNHQNPTIQPQKVMLESNEIYMVRGDSRRKAFELLQSKLQQEKHSKKIIPMKLYDEECHEHNNKIRKSFSKLRSKYGEVVNVRKILNKIKDKKEKQFTTMKNEAKRERMEMWNDVELVKSKLLEMYNIKKLKSI